MTSPSHQRVAPLADEDDRRSPRAIDMEAFIPSALTNLAQKITATASATYRPRFGVGITNWRVIALLASKPWIAPVQICEIDRARQGGRQPRAARSRGGRARRVAKRRRTPAGAGRADGEGSRDPRSDRRRRAPAPRASAQRLQRRGARATEGLSGPDAPAGGDDQGGRLKAGPFGRRRNCRRAGQGYTRPWKANGNDIADCADPGGSGRGGGDRRDRRGGRLDASGPRAADGSAGHRHGGAGAKGSATPALPVEAPAPPVGAASSAATDAPGRPAFDIVSVNPDGETVVAGRAAPNARVTLLDGGRTIGEATADAQGQFVILPDPLRPGDHSLVLSTGAGGPAERSGAAPVSVAAAPAPGPAASPAATPTKAQVAIRSVEADASGRLSAQGFAAPNATVRLYVGGAFVGDARTAADGRWSLTIEGGMTPGAYAIRADQVEAGDARVLARAEASVTVPALADASPAAPRTPAPLAPLLPPPRHPPPPTSWSGPCRPIPSSAATRCGGSARNSTATERATRSSSRPTPARSAIRT